VVCCGGTVEWRKLRKRDSHLNPLCSTRYETSKACSMNGEEVKHEKFWLKNLKGRNHLPDIGIDGLVMLLLF
jgi:hypothetical protein